MSLGVPWRNPEKKLQPSEVGQVLEGKLPLCMPAYGAPRVVQGGDFGWGMLGEGR